MSASLVIPVMNEETVLWENTEVIIRYLEENLNEYEVLLVENGSIDRTPDITKTIAEYYEQVKEIHLPESSLGESLRRGVNEARYDNVVYFPIDLSINLSFIRESVELLKRYEVVLGSKRLREALDNRSTSRRLLSKGYHKAVRILFRTDLTDTTCVKAYRRDIAKSLMEAIPSGSSVFETEVLLEAQRRKCMITQIPVKVNDNRRGRIPIKFKVISKGQDLLSLRVDLFSILGGSALFLSGAIWIGYLSLQKLVLNKQGFLNSYSYLISMLLIIFGAQGIVYGLFARLLLQLRQEITRNNSRNSGNVLGEETK